MNDVGKYLKILLLPVTVYLFTGLVLYGSGEGLKLSPPSGGVLSYITWLFNAVGTIIGATIQSMTFPMLPDPLRLPLTVVFGALFVYGLVGLIASIAKLLKPFG